MWDRFGNVDSYVEPFFGSGAVLLGRPHEPQTETVNDIDCMIANFWRALSMEPEAVAHHADWPVNEADLHARHLWLVNQLEFRERMKTEPDYFDAKIAGFWVWGISQWIGSGWCLRPEWTGRTNAANFPRGLGAKRVHQKRPMVAADNNGKGVHRKMPNLGDDGRGNNRVSQQIPLLSSDQGIHGKKMQSGLYAYMYELAARLRRVRVCCGDWKRVTGPNVTIKHGTCGIFLDPPYDMRIVEGKNGKGKDGLYSDHSNDVSKEVRDWCIENGDNPLLRIALCGYEGEHDMPDRWNCVAWKAKGGFGNQGDRSGPDNSARERIWFSPACISVGPLFANL